MIWGAKISKGFWAAVVAAVWLAVGSAWAAPASLVPRPDRISDRQARLALTRLLLETGRIESARSQLDRVAAQGPTDAQLEDLRGDLALAQDRPAEAAAAFDRALKLEPGSVRLDRKLALALSWAGQNEAAYRRLSRLYERRPDDPKIGLELVRVMARTGRLSQAARLAKTLAEAHPDEPKPALELADVELSQGHARAARRIYLRVAADHPEMAGLKARLATRMLGWGDFQRSAALLREAIEADPKSVDLKLSLAEAYSAGQRYARAEQVYRLLLLSAPADRRALEGLTRSQLRAKDFAAAAITAARLTVARPDLASAWLLLARAETGRGRYNEAAVAAKRAVQLPGGREAGLIQWGRVLLHQNQPQSARAKFDLALKQAPNLVAARFAATILAGQKPEPIIDRLVKPGAEKPLDLVAWGDLLAAEGWPGPAARCYGAALAADRDLLAAALGRADSLAGQKKYDRALKIYDRLCQELDRPSKLIIGRARILSWARRYADSLRIYDLAIAADKTDSVPVLEKARVAGWAKDIDLQLKTLAGLYRRPVDGRLKQALRTVDLPPVLDKAGQRIKADDPAATVFKGYQEFRAAVDKARSGLPSGMAARLDRLLIDLGAEYDIQKTAWLERQAKYLAWNRRWAPAARAYARLTAHHPGNQEALFDYGQVLCSLGLCDREEGVYRTLQRIDPTNNLVGVALERLERRKRPKLQAAHSFWEENGHGDLSRIARQRTDLRADVPLACRHQLELSLHRWREDAPRTGQVYEANGFSLAFRPVINEYLKLGLGWTYKGYQDSTVGDSHTGFARIDLNLDNYLGLALGWRRTDEIYNAFGVIQTSQADRFGLEVTSGPTRWLDLTAGLEYLNYSDDNNGWSAPLSLAFGMTDHPRQLKLIVAGQWRQTDRTSVFIYSGPRLQNIIHPYWTPQDYLAGSITLDWRHDLAKEFFCGARQHFYNLKLSLVTDTEGNSGFGLSGEYVNQVTDHWLVGLSGLIHRSQDWDAEGLWLRLGYNF